MCHDNQYTIVVHYCFLVLKKWKKKYHIGFSKVMITKKWGCSNSNNQAIKIIQVTQNKTIFWNLIRKSWNNQIRKKIFLANDFLCCNWLGLGIQFLAWKCQSCHYLHTTGFPGGISKIFLFWVGGIVFESLVSRFGAGSFFVIIPSEKTLWYRMLHYYKWSCRANRLIWCF